MTSKTENLLQTLDTLTERNAELTIQMKEVMARRASLVESYEKLRVENQNLRRTLKEVLEGKTVICANDQSPPSESCGQFTIAK